MTHSDFDKLAKILYEMNIKESDIENIHVLIHDIVYGYYDENGELPF